MKKGFILLIAFFVCLYFLPLGSPNFLVVDDLFASVDDNDVIIIFNSGGWGNTLPKDALDFYSILEGIKETLNEKGYDSIVVPYNRTKKTFFGKAIAIREFIVSFDLSSRDLANKVEFLNKKLPNNKIIIAGLSVGGALTVETMEKVSEKTKDSVYAIVAGTPFWHNSFDSESVLLLDNNGKDSLTNGGFGQIFLSLIKTPFRWIYSRIKGQKVSLAQALFVPSHQYSWSSPEVSNEITVFIGNKF